MKRRVFLLVILSILFVWMPNKLRAQGFHYDVNNDGQVTITDVTELVDYILNGVSEAPTIEEVDLGLPSGTLWASCNLGATKSEEYGGYYAWGELEEKEDYSWSNYKWCKGTYNSITKYCIGSYGTHDSKAILDPDDDVAHVMLGGNWRMPTSEEIKELTDNCTKEWTTLNGVYGNKLVSNINGNSIFLPACGYKKGTSLTDEGIQGCYWTNITFWNFGYLSLCLASNDERCSTSTQSRNLGLTIRPVRSSVVLPLAISETSLTFDTDISTSTSVYITSGSGYYSVMSSNDAVATAELSSYSPNPNGILQPLVTLITVKGIGVGTAEIIVTDTYSQETLTIAVTVVAPGE